MKLILKIYDWFSAHKTFMWLSLAALTLLFAVLLLRLKFSENISDFLPLDSTDREALAVYQNTSGAGRLYFLFDNPDDELLTVEAMEYFAARVEEKDSLGWCRELVLGVDMSKIQEVSDFVYSNMPYFLTSSDYERMDSLLSTPGFVRERLENDRNMLLFPSGGMLSSSISRDPLGLFSSVMSSLESSSPGVGFEICDGYIFTPDMSRAVAMMDSPFGNSETEHNSRLLKMLRESLDEMEREYPAVSAEIVGGPEIAVGNSSRIKKDSIIAVSLSLVLILLLAAYSISSLRNILLLFLSIGWGWLFAMAGVSLFCGSVSMIVIGISSVILGIAVNYPLHLVVHSSYSPSMRRTIREIISPLVVGNITTVGAFLALVPLKAVALRDLGLFASLLLAGTIVFVLLYLPHFVETRPVREGKHRLLDRLCELRPDRSKGLVGLILVMTIVFAFFSTKTEFDSNISNINYMTPRQKADMDYFQTLLSQSTNPDLRTVYVLSSGADFDRALEENAAQKTIVDSLESHGAILKSRSVRPFLSSEAEQRERLGLWADFVRRHSDLLTVELPSQAAKLGFSKTAFSGFDALVRSAGDFIPQGMDYFSPLTKEILSQNVTILDDGRPYVVDVLTVEKDNLENVKSCFGHCFDLVSLNSALSNKLSDNFNYIGWVCSLIVFLFLWFSFGSFTLALISFLPMALSWIWILGIMSVFGIKFNIVNIILATFIFGQGDDYTIFITEGCQYEYARRKPILPAYKSSILQSALIMFVGIGTLIVAKHPAMKSLAQVTITGMASVILMAYVIPPLLFNFLTVKNGSIRPHPLTLKTLLFGPPKDALGMVRGRYIYKGKEILRAVGRNLNSSTLANVESRIEKGCREYGMSDDGYGETALYLALTHPDVRIIAKVTDAERRQIACVAAEGFVENLEFVS